MQYGGKRFRFLTAGEITMAAQLFGDAIDYRKVRIYHRRYLPFGLQPKHCAMAPNGHLYFHQSRCLPDFSNGSATARHWFMHEMTHVWQHQLGYPVRLRGAVRIGLRYDYALGAERTLADYNMEAQGELLADYFMLQPGQSSMRAQFEQVLASFLADPASRRNLPKGLFPR